MPPPFLPPFFPPSVSCQIGGGERAGGRHAWSVLRYLMMTSFLEASPARSLFPLQRRMQTFSDFFFNVAEGSCSNRPALSGIHTRVFCPYFHGNAAELRMPNCRCCRRKRVFVRRPVKRCCIRIRAFSANLPARSHACPCPPSRHSPCCVLPHPMTFAYSPTKDSL